MGRKVSPCREGTRPARTGMSPPVQGWGRHSKGGWCLCLLTQERTGQPASPCVLGLLLQRATWT